MLCPNAVASGAFQVWTGCSEALVRPVQQEGGARVPTGLRPGDSQFWTLVSGGLVGQWRCNGLCSFCFSEKAVTADSLPWGSGKVLPADAFVTWVTAAR